MDRRGGDRLLTGEIGIDPGDDPLDPAPALRGIVELHEAPHLAAAGRHLEAFGGALLQRRDMAGEHCVWSEAKDPIHPVGAAPIEHFRTGVMAVGA